MERATLCVRSRGLSHMGGHSDILSTENFLKRGVPAHYYPSSHALVLQYRELDKCESVFCFATYFVDLVRGSAKAQAVDLATFTLRLTLREPRRQL